MKRDLSKAQYERAMVRNGWAKGYFGYWEYKGRNVHPIIYLDGKPRYRAKLAGMLASKNKIDNELL